MNQITLENVTIQYENTPVIKNLSLKINSGDYICVLGENGSGKSTLLKGMLGLKKTKSGKITYNIRKNQIGYLPQRTQLQKDFPCSVREVVMSGLVSKKGLRPFFTKSEKQLAKKQMERLGVWDFKDKSINELSGGQQQRAFLARALCAGESLLILDEPVTGLDKNISEIFYETVTKLNDEGITIFTVSHDTHLALKNAKKILYLENDGYFFGGKEEFLKKYPQECICNHKK